MYEISAKRLWTSRSRDKMNILKQPVYFLFVFLGRGFIPIYNTPSIAFIIVVFVTTFRPLCSPTFPRCTSIWVNLQGMEFWREPFIKSTRLNCSRSTADIYRYRLVLMLLNTVQLLHACFHWVQVHTAQRRDWKKTQSFYPLGHGPIGQVAGANLEL